MNIFEINPLDKPFRILRARKNSERRNINTYFQYRDTLEDCIKAKKLDRWECEKLHIETFDAEKRKWFVYQPIDKKAKT